MASSLVDDKKTLHFPRILCLHGGGVTAEVFRLQMRAVLRELSSRFRLVFADGPFFCDAGPGIVPVYEGMGPYRRWLRWRDEHAEVDTETAVEEIEHSLKTAMAADDAAGADGPWVAVLGFSQGAKLAASLLYEQQQKTRKLGKDKADSDWKFGVILAARAPIVSLSPLTAHPRLPPATEISEGFNLDGPPIEEPLQIPTIHLHGLKDAGVELHRKLTEVYCDPKTSVVLEWDGDHRIPFKTPDVKLLCDAIHEMADSCQVPRPNHYD